MENLDILMSDQFIAFSKTIEQCTLTKRKLKEEFKQIYEDYQTRIKQCEKDAVEAQTVFETWKSEFYKNAGDG